MFLPARRSFPTLCYTVQVVFVEKNAVKKKITTVMSVKKDNSSPIDKLLQCTDLSRNKVIFSESNLLKEVLLVKS